MPTPPTLCRSRSQSAAGAAPRRLALEGAVNFRDLGGYATEDGRVTAWGRLYRSDALAKLTQTDLECIAALGLNSIYDLRHESERAERPNRLPRQRLGIDGPREHTVGFLPHGAASIMRRARTGELGTDEAQTAFRELYRRFPLEYRDVYRGILVGLGTRGALPALIHCTSGKDRTGFAIALLLRALGVPRTTVIADYLITDRYRHDLSHLLHPNLAPQTVETVLRADRDYLALSFATIDERWGSDDAYLRQGIGLTDTERRALRAQLLAPPESGPD